MDALFIVSEDKDKIFANFLNNLITKHDDIDDKVIGTRDDSLSTTIWDKKMYMSNIPGFSSENHLLFLGDASWIKKEYVGAEDIFSQCGMTFGTIGNRAYMKVSVKKDDLKDENLEEFIALSQKYALNYTKEKLLSWDSFIETLKTDNILGTLFKIEKRALKKAYWLAVPYVGPFIYGTKHIEAEKLELIYSAKFMCLTKIVYMDHLSNFMGA